MHVIAKLAASRDCAVDVVAEEDAVVTMRAPCTLVVNAEVNEEVKAAKHGSTAERSSDEDE